MGVRLVGNFVLIMILARLLSPEQFGLHALAMSVIAMTMILVDMGLGNAVIQRKSVTQEQLSTLYWINLALALILMAAIWNGAPLIAEFYHEERIIGLLRLLSFAFLFTGSAQLIRFMAEKELEFKSIALTELVAFVFGFCVTVGSGLYGLGAYSFGIGYLANSALFACLAWGVLAKGWRPSFVCALADSMSLLKFGMKVFATSLVNSLGAQADLIIAGRLASSASVGLYSQPRDLTFKLVLMINPIVTRVGLPLIAKKHPDRDAVAAIYKKTIRMVAFVNFPLFGFIYLFSDPITLIYLGPTWADAAPYLEASAIWMCFRCLGNPIGSLLIGTGRPGQAFFSSLLVTISVFCVGYYAVSAFGLGALAQSLAMFYAFLIIPFWYFNIRPACNLGFKEYLGQILPAAVATAAAVFLAQFATRSIEDALVVLVAGVFLGGASYIAVSFGINRDALNTMLRLVRAPKGVIK